MGVRRANTFGVTSTFEGVALLAENVGEGSDQDVAIPAERKVDRFENQDVALLTENVREGCGNQGVAMLAENVRVGCGNLFLILDLSSDLLSPLVRESITN